jgi:hypothetical protein
MYSSTSTQTYIVQGHRMRVVYTCENHAANVWIRDNFPSQDTMAEGEYQIMGMDIEWKPSVVPVAALLQLADPWGNVLLFHMFHVQSRSPPMELLRVMGSSRVLKVGVAVMDDVRKLQQRWPMDVSGVVDLVHAQREQASTFGSSAMESPPGNGLGHYAKHFANIVSWKSKSVATSNWEAWPLSYGQKAYAAMDAYAGALVFKNMRVFCSVVETLLKRDIEREPPPSPSLIASPSALAIASK